MPASQNHILNQRTFVFIVIVVFFSNIVHGTFQIIEPSTGISDELLHKELQIFNFKFMGKNEKHFNITSSFVAANPWNACNKLKGNSSQYQDKIVMTQVGMFMIKLS